MQSSKGSSNDPTRPRSDAAIASPLENETIVYWLSPYSGQPVFERGRMVSFEGVKRFKLKDLLRASPEMLGKGGFGMAYKAVLYDGNVRAIKRLNDAQIGEKTQFEQHMAVLGRLSHPNIVSLKAYYFAWEEKLLVYDYMPNGCLFGRGYGIRDVSSGSEMVKIFVESWCEFSEVGFCQECRGDGYNGYVEVRGLWVMQISLWNRDITTVYGGWMQGSARWTWVNNDGTTR
ncbi:hypothetical protein ACFX13_013497 [Malus domestica]